LSKLKKNESRWICFVSKPIQVSSVKKLVKLGKVKLGKVKLGKVK